MSQINFDTNRGRSATGHSSLVHRRNNNTDNSNPVNSNRSSNENQQRTVLVHAIPITDQSQPTANLPQARAIVIWDNRYDVEETQSTGNSYNNFEENRKDYKWPFMIIMASLNLVLISYLLYLELIGRIHYVNETSQTEIYDLNELLKKWLDKFLF